MSGIHKIMTTSPRTLERPRWERCVRCGIDTKIRTDRGACADCRAADSHYVRVALGHE